LLGAVSSFYFLRSDDLPEAVVTTTTKSDVIDYQLDYGLFKDNILNAGPPKDGIPPIDSPVYISVTEADQYLEDYEPVFIYEDQDDVFVFPQNILVWHEIVNDTIGGESLAITYCPLTGSTICYINDPTHENNTFGTSGNLLNSNLVMYDRSTESYIPQILGIGITDDLEGQLIKTRPIHWTTWQVVKEHYTSAMVLSEETGFLRDYNEDPYGTYHPDDEDSYYATGVPFFPLLNDNDGTFDDKTVVVGIKVEDAFLAIDPKLVASNKVINFTIANQPAVAIWDDTLKAVRVFSREVNGTTLEFVFNKGLTDQNGLSWQSDGIAGDLRLDPLTYFDVMWFAWHAFYPNTEVLK
jgi:hypothetical protein